MQTLTTSIDDAFKQKMADIFPSASYSNLKNVRLKSSMFSIENLKQINFESPNNEYNLNENIQNHPNHALKIKEWLIYNQLNNLDETISSTKYKKEINSILNAQLGEKWKGIEAQNSFRKLTILALAAYSNGYDIKDFLSDINQWALSCIVYQSQQNKSGVYKFNGENLVNTDIINYARPVVEMMQTKHYWSNTFILSIIERAKISREVLPGAYFCYLKNYDRMFWLLLNDYGRRENKIETVGVYAHFFAEKTIKKPLEETFFTDLIDSIIDSVNEPV